MTLCWSPERSLKRHKTNSPPVLRSPSVKHFSRKRDRCLSYPLYCDLPDLSDLSDLQLMGNLLICELDMSLDASLDLESLPDLTDETTTESPFVEKAAFVDILSPHHTSIFEVPEIVYKIVEFAHLKTIADGPKETPARRRPLLFDHAILIYGDKERALQALRDPVQAPSQPSKILFTCLQVNRLFHSAARDLLRKKLYFNDAKKVHNFILNISLETTLRPTELVLHKLFHTKQPLFDQIVQAADFSRLERVELFMCPRLRVVPDMLTLQLTTLVVTGSKTMDDLVMYSVGQRCSNLEVLDIRACELITDAGIYSIASHCSNLTSINVGRKNKGHLITDASMCMLARNNSRLATVGVAGCNVSDRFVWDLALSCGANIQRLSLNNCKNVSNLSVPLILYSDYFPELSVLEIMNVDQITNFRPIIEFKRRQEMKGIPVLLEVCELLCRTMRQQEVEMDRAISKRIFKDIAEWANCDNDGDRPFRDLISVNSGLVA